MSKKICYNTCLIYFVVVCLFVGLRICSYYGIFSFLGEYSSLVMSFVTQIGLIFLLPLLLFKSFNNTSLKQTANFCGYKKISAKTLLLSFGLGFVVFFLNVYVSTFFNSMIALFGYTPSSKSVIGEANVWTLLLQLLTTAVLPAICEETLHRGLLMNGLSSFSIKKAILISGFLFGLLHLNIEQVFYASIIGLFLGYLACGSNSIYPCIIVHFMNNAISVIFSFLSAKGINIFAGISTYLSANPIIGLLLVILVFILLFLVGNELVKEIFKESFRFNFKNKQKALTNQAIRENFFAQVEEIKEGKEQRQAIYSTDKNVVYVDFSEFLNFVSRSFEQSKKERTPEKQEVQDKNIDLKIKVLLFGSFLLSGIVTVMTFIWGLLR